MKQHRNRKPLQLETRTQGIFEVEILWEREGKVIEDRFEAAHIGAEGGFIRFVELGDKRIFDYAPGRVVKITLTRKMIEPVQLDPVQVVGLK